MRTFIAVILFLIINTLLQPLALRLDVSKGRAYTLSDATKKVIKEIDKSVTIDFFVSSDLPTRLIPLRREVTDLLNEYKKQGGSKIDLKTLDPKKDKNAQTLAQQNGIPELQFSQVEQDKYAVSSSYFGIALAKGDKRESLPQVTEIGSLEYNLTAAIYKLIRKDTPKVGIIGQEESYDPQQDALGSFRQVLFQQFQLDTLSSSSASAQIDSSYKAVFVFDDNSHQFSDEEVRQLSDYLQNGGKVALFVDGVWVGDSLTATPAKHNLTKLLNDWGITLHQDLVLSTAAELVNFGNSTNAYLFPYPFWLKANNVNTKTSYFSNITSLTFPWTSSLTLNKKSGVTVTELVRTTSRSWSQKDTFTLNPQAITPPTQKDLKSFIIGAEAKNGKGELLVIPSSRFILERYLNRNSDNLEFVLNVANDFASGGALAGIRQRTVSVYPLPDIADNQKDIFRYANILILPGIFILYAVLRLMKRR